MKLNLTDLADDFRYEDEAMSTAESLILLFRDEQEPFGKERETVERRENLRCLYSCL